MISLVVDFKFIFFCIVTESRGPRGKLAKKLISVCNYQVLN